jgi:hypothetical protein
MYEHWEVFNTELVTVGNLINGYTICCIVARSSTRRSTSSSEAIATMTMTDN